jgi:hypothetical protein
MELTKDAPTTIVKTGTLEIMIHQKPPKHAPNAGMLLT